MIQPTNISISPSDNSHTVSAYVDLGFAIQTNRRANSAQLLPPDNATRRKHEELLLDKLYDMGILSV